MATKKFYVVWKGYEPGIYDTWEECLKQVVGFENARYKSYTNIVDARRAFEDGAEITYQKSGGQETAKQEFPISGAITVDAASSGNPGLMEYRGVMLDTRKQIFHIGPLEDGTNNIGEFLALVHALALCKKHNINVPIYTDSITAMAWVRNKKAKTLLAITDKNEKIFDLIRRAEDWLRNNTWENKIYKWDTARWGEIPADFGRK